MSEGTSMNHNEYQLENDHCESSAAVLTKFSSTQNNEESRGTGGRHFSKFEEHTMIEAMADRNNENRFHPMGSILPRSCE